MTTNGSGPSTDQCISSIIDLLEKQHVTLMNHQSAIDAIIDRLVLMELKVEDLVSKAGNVKHV